MSHAKDGDAVKVHYTGTLDDGTVFDSSAGRDPLDFTVGQGNVIAGFDDAVRGMLPGESKTVTIPFDEAYGPRDVSLLISVERTELPEDLVPEVGQQLGIQTPSGQMMPVTISAVFPDSITLDANHPLAGEDLTFQIELVSIN